MKTETDQDARISFGRLLQKTRLEKRIRLADISRQTRIRVPVLLAIEKEALDRLPPEPYLQGLLKAFAKAVGADIQDVLRRYEQDRRNYDKSARFQSVGRQSGGGDWLKLGLVLGLLVLLAAGSIYLMTFVAGKMNPEKAVSEARDRHGELSDKAENGSGGRASFETLPEKRGAIPEDRQKKGSDHLKTDGYLLSIHAVKETWLKVIADNQEMVQYHLKTGDRLDLTASSRFNILISDAKGVRITLNDRPFPLSGKKGQIINVEIP